IDVQFPSADTLTTIYKPARALAPFPPILFLEPADTSTLLGHPQATIAIASGVESRGVAIFSRLSTKLIWTFHVLCNCTIFAYAFVKFTAFLVDEATGRRMKELPLTSLVVLFIQMLSSATCVVWMSPIAFC